MRLPPVILVLGLTTASHAELKLIPIEHEHEPSIIGHHIEIGNDARATFHTMSLPFEPVIIPSDVKTYTNNKGATLKAPEDAQLVTTYSRFY